MPSLSEGVLRRLRNRRGLLWVCQPYDLTAGQAPHDLTLTDTEAYLRYRHHPTETDDAVSQLWWEAVWTESATSPLVDVMRNGANSRQVYLAASEADAAAQISTSVFQPIYSTIGYIDPRLALGSQYGRTKPGIRKRVAQALRDRLGEYPGRCLVVLGATSAADLDGLREVIDAELVTDLEILLVGSEVDVEWLGATAASPVSRWSGSAFDLCKRLAEEGVPSPRELASFPVRVGRETVSVPEEVFRQVSRDFKVVSENDLAATANTDFEALLAFLSGSLEQLTAFGGALPVARDYQTNRELDLLGEALHAIEALDQPSATRSSFILELPAEPGSGATTMLRSVAVELASQGHPALIMRPSRLDVDFESLLAYANSLTVAASPAAGGKPATLVVALDAENAAGGTAVVLAQRLSVAGRRALILKVTSLCPEDEQGLSPATEPSYSRLEPLRSTVTEAEVERCAVAFARLAQECGLAIQSRTVADWKAYCTSTMSAAGELAPQLFWVAIRFFLLEDLDYSSRDLLRAAMSGWINRRADLVDNPDMQRVLEWVAVLAVYRLPAPLFTVLRPVTGGGFSSELVPLVRDLDGILLWDVSDADGQEQVLRFQHPAIAEELLWSRGYDRDESRIGLLYPVLGELGTSDEDSEIASALASRVFTPRWEDRTYLTDWEWRLRAFEHISPLLAEQDKTVLHHWARCLYLSGEKDLALDDHTRTLRYQEAIAKLERAIELPRRDGHDEHPGHLYNTLGTAYYKLQEHLTRLGDADGAQRAWDKAYAAFQESLRLLPASNMDAMLALSRRLLERSGAWQGQRCAPDDPRRVSATEHVLEALSLLDQADEMLKNSTAPEPNWETGIRQYFALAVEWLQEGSGLDYARELEHSENREVGYLLETRLVMGIEPGDSELDEALAVLDRARDGGLSDSARLLSLRLSVLGRHSKLRLRFREQLEIHQSLRSLPDYHPRAIDDYRHAVLLYQCGLFEQGQRAFRDLRSRIRQEELGPPHVSDFMRSPTDPELPQVVNVRVDRIVRGDRAEGYVDAIRQNVRLLTRHWSPPIRVGQIAPCAIRFNVFGPSAVPEDFIRQPNRQ